MNFGHADEFFPQSTDATKRRSTGGKSPSDWSSMMPYMRRISRRPGYPYRMPAPWILAVCPLEPKSGMASTRHLSERRLPANVAGADRSLPELPTPQGPATPLESVGLRVFKRSKGRTEQTALAPLDISRLLATRTSRLTGGPGKRPFFPSADRDRNA
jgi:hypothetical protein